MGMHSEFVISQTDGRPMYLQIIEQIKNRIAVGDWPRGHELPSIRQLAVTLRVSVITVKRAYFELEREGVIVTQHGKGSTVADTPNLSPRRFEEAFEHHLNETVRLARLLKLDTETLLGRVRHAARSSEKEPV